MAAENEKGNGLGEKKGFSFGFSKKKDIKQLENTALEREEVGIDKEPDFVTSLEGKEVKALKPKEKKKELVIPLIANNRWYHPAKPEDLDYKDSNNEKTIKETKLDDLSCLPDTVESQAVRELVEDAQRYEDFVQNGDKNKSNVSIPLMMRNRVPDGFETDNKLDVSLRPDEAEAANYDEVPIEHYGLAMLKGMGWKEGQGIGKKHATKSVIPLDAILRPKGLGLGADKSLLLQAQGKNNKEKSSDKDEEKLTMRKGTHCFIHTGKHADLYGTVEGTDEDNSRVMVKLTLSGQVVTPMQFAVKLVTKKEYDKNSKILNKSKVDKYKQRELNRQQNNSEEDSDVSERHKHRKHKQHKHDKHRDKHNKHRDKSDKHKNGYDKHRDSESDGDYSKHSRHRDERSHKDRTRSEDTGKSSDHDKYRYDDRSSESSRYEDTDYDRSRHKMRDGYADSDGQPRNKKRKQEYEDKKEISTSVNSRYFWLRPHLRVHVIDKHYKKGKFYKEKVIIEDVVSLDTCICKTEDGKILEDIRQSMLETVIPKSDPAYVMIISGIHRAQFAKILEKDKSACQATLQLISDRDKIVELDYDVICEYTGDIGTDFDY